MFFAIRLSSGKAVPLDAAPAADGKYLLYVEEHGKLYVSEVELSHDSMKRVDEHRYTSHFQTCPQASSHSRKAKR